VIAEAFRPLALRGEVEVEVEGLKPYVDFG
jgi:hypothetical protein